MSDYSFKNLSDIDTVESPADGTTVMGFQNGSPIQMPMNAVKGSGGGGVFVINPDDSDYSTTDAAYGDKIKEALLSGKQVWVYRKDTFDYDVHYYCLVRSFCPTYKTTTKDTMQLKIYYEDSNHFNWLTFAITT